MLKTTRLHSLFVLDQDEALEFYVGKLGLEVHTDQDLGFMRWLTVNVPGDRGREILLEKPAPPSMDDGTAGTVRELVTKGATAGWIGFSTDDARATYEDLLANGVEMPQEPTEQPYGIAFGLPDPFGNAVRILQPA